MESKLADETTVINPFVYGICQKRTLCYTFAVKNPSLGSLHTRIRFGDKQKTLNSTNMAMDAVMIGNCTGKNAMTCSRESPIVYAEVTPVIVSYPFAPPDIEIKV